MVRDILAIQASSIALEATFVRQVKFQQKAEFATIGSSDDELESQEFKQVCQQEDITIDMIRQLELNFKGEYKY
ncbi:hypothetical protein H5410_059681 [Solanum commersonii]|uniref:Uncharacterized protein n=1 Tax=Solanum commersonii TaxID=4109 RepID=A0A9J5W318_SOLCO|nr:hypothetical protein H5410_059681 [Solanum commersonii]